LIFRKGEVASLLLTQEYECVIVDEAHRARRMGLSPGCEENRNPELNNLMDFLISLAPKTKSLLLATATPVQIHPVEAWDFLRLLAVGNDRILGNVFSHWAYPKSALEAVSSPPADLLDEEFWKWIANPFPPVEEETNGGKKEFQLLRRALDLKEMNFLALPADYSKLRAPDKERVRKLRKDFFRFHNPFIRNIIRRTRSYLEETNDPETGKPYLEKVEVRLFGEKEEEAINLPAYLEAAYESTKEYCQSLAKSGKGKGFLQTLLLRRMGSTFEAGKNTVDKLIGVKPNNTLQENLVEEDDDNEEESYTDSGDTSLLLTIKKTLEMNQDEDPKYKLFYDILTRGVNGTEKWLDRGCIISVSYTHLTLPTIYSV